MVDSIYQETTPFTTRDVCPSAVKNSKTSIVGLRKENLATPQKYKLNENYFIIDHSYDLNIHKIFIFSNMSSNEVIQAKSIQYNYIFPDFPFNVVEVFYSRSSCVDNPCGKDSIKANLIILNLDIFSKNYKPNSSVGGFKKTFTVCQQ